MTVQELLDFLLAVEDKERTVAMDGENGTFRVLDRMNCSDADIFDGHVVIG